MIKGQAANGTRVQREDSQLEAGHVTPEHNVSIRTARHYSRPISGTIYGADAAVMDLVAALQAAATAKGQVSCCKASGARSGELRLAVLHSSCGLPTCTPHTLSDMQIHAVMSCCAMPA
jgi:hypothetical protein